MNLYIFTKKRQLILFAVILIYTSLAQAQFNVDKLKDKAKEKLNKNPSKNDKPNAESIEKPSKNILEQSEDEKFFAIPQKLPPPIYKDKRGNKLGRIIFSKNPIYFNQENKNDLSNTFKAGEQVFGLAYLPDSKRKLDLELGYKIYIYDMEDGSGYSSSFEYAPFQYESDKDGTSFGDKSFYDLDIFANNESAWDAKLTEEFLFNLVVEMNTEAKKGSKNESKKIHKLKVEILNKEGLAIAVGIFNYDLRTEQEKIYAMYETHKQANLKAFKLPTSKRNDAVLANQIKALMTERGSNVQKVSFTSSDWAIIRHEISGVVLHRVIFAYVVTKNSKGECEYAETKFLQQAVNGIFSNKLEYAGIGFDTGKILCENVK